MRGCTAGESEVEGHAIAVSDYNVQITVGVEECWNGVLSEGDISERVFRLRLLLKVWIRGAAGVFEMENTVMSAPNKHVHVTIFVDVDASNDVLEVALHPLAFVICGVSRLPSSG